jgi:hypothetical protein
MVLIPEKGQLMTAGCAPPSAASACPHPAPATWPPRVLCGPLSLKGPSNCAQVGPLHPRVEPCCNQAGARCGHACQKRVAAEPAGEEGRGGRAGKARKGAGAGHAALCRKGAAARPEEPEVRDVPVPRVGGGDFACTGGAGQAGAGQAGRAHVVDPPLHRGGQRGRHRAGEVQRRPQAPPGRRHRARCPSPCGRARRGAGSRRVRRTGERPGARRCPSKNPLARAQGPSPPAPGAPPLPLPALLRASFLLPRPARIHGVSGSPAAPRGRQWPSLTRRGLRLRRSRAAGGQVRCGWQGEGDQALGPSFSRAVRARRKSHVMHTPNHMCSLHVKSRYPLLSPSSLSYPTRHQQ